MASLTDPKLWLMVLIISLVGVLTKLVYYRIGKQGSDAVMEHVPNMTPDKWVGVEERYQVYGSRALLLTSVPGLGSAIAAAAGIMNTRMGTFIILVLISNLIRNWLLVFVFGQTLSILPIGG